MTLRLTEIFNLQQINGALRVIVPMICTWLAAKGFSALGDAGIVAEVSTVILGLAAVIWSLMAHTDHNTLANAAAIDPQVQVKVPDHVILDNHKIADLVADPRVPNVTALNQGK